MRSHAMLRTRRGTAIRLAFGVCISSLVVACSGAADAQGGPPQAASVSVAPAVQRSVSDSEEFSGRLEASEFVEVRPRVGGTIDRVHFVAGALVTRGQLLFSIDARPFAAEVARAESQLAAAQSRAELAQSELVQAPIAGRLSRANVTAGNLVNEQVVLTSIAGVAKVYAYFDGSEQTYLRVKAANERAPVVRMGLANEAGHPHEGRVDFVDNRLNPQTGAIRMRARFDNADGRFTPVLAVKLTMGASGHGDGIGDGLPRFGRWLDRGAALTRRHGAYWAFRSPMRPCPVPGSSATKTTS